MTLSTHELLLLLELSNSEIGRRQESRQAAIAAGDSKDEVAMARYLTEYQGLGFRLTIELQRALSARTPMVTTQDKARGDAPQSLGDLLYVPNSAPVQEEEWVKLVKSIAAGDGDALHALHQRVHRIVYTLAIRIVGNRLAAEEVTLDVFDDIWKEAPGYDPASGTVVAWIMNLARVRAMSNSSLPSKRSARARPQEHGSVAMWPPDIMPAQSWARLARRVGNGNERESSPISSRPWTEPAWREAAPGICVQMLATDTLRERVSMLVRLDPDVEYPPHTHAGVEELHLLNGELWINDSKFAPGAYHRAEPGTADELVWSETGCTCVLITSPRDLLR